MIAIELRGGMGNQLFQYFFGYAMSRKYGLEIKYVARHYKLAFLNLPIEFVKPDGLRMIREPSFKHNDMVPRENSLYRGYWQSEKYFAQFKEGVLGLIKPSIKKENAISVHIRRGDYLRLQHIHPVLPIEYYLSAVARFPDHTPYVFSDDIRWCRENLPKSWEFASTPSDEHDFFSMMIFPAHVIANSTFSWWAAWLSQSTNVIAPSRWFGHKCKHNTRDLIPASWSII